MSAVKHDFLRNHICTLVFFVIRDLQSVEVERGKLGPSLTLTLLIYGTLRHCRHIDKLVSIVSVNGECCNMTVFLFIERVKQ